MHGEELSYLGTVNLRPDQPAGQVGNCQLKWHRDRHGRLQMYKGRVINLYYAEKYTTVDEVAKSLSHEYGHLFTYYWLIKRENKLPDDPTSGWAAIRQLHDLPVRWRGSQLPYSHFWEPAEIMADEYALLFAPAVAKADISQLQRYVENTAVTPPDSVPGLREYWLNLAGLGTSSTPPLLQPQLVSLQPQSLDSPWGPQPAYAISFAPASEDVEQQARLQYSLSWSTQAEPYGRYSVGMPITQQGSADFIYGSHKTAGDTWLLVNMPAGKGFFRVCVLDPLTGQYTHSPMYWFDFTDPLQPRRISDQFRYDDNRIRVYIDHQLQTYQQPPLIINNKTMVPMRSIFEALGAQVAWHGADRSITARQDDTVIQLVLDRPLAYINGQPVPLAQPPTLVNSRTMVPIRFISEALGAQVHWDQSRRAVEIIRP